MKILLYLSIIWSYQTSYRLLTKSMTNIHINIEKNKNELKIHQIKQIKR